MNPLLRFCLAFKRLKSLLHLDALTAKDPELAQAFLFGKLLLFALTERLSRSGGGFFPLGLRSPRRERARCRSGVSPNWPSARSSG